MHSQVGFRHAQRWSTPPTQSCFINRQSANRKNRYNPHHSNTQAIRIARLSSNIAGCAHRCFETECDLRPLRRDRRAQEISGILDSVLSPNVLNRIAPTDCGVVVRSRYERSPLPPVSFPRCDSQSKANCRSRRNCLHDDIAVCAGGVTEASCAYFRRCQPPPCIRRWLPGVARSTTRGERDGQVHKSGNYRGLTARSAR